MQNWKNGLPIILTLAAAAHGLAFAAPASRLAAAMEFIGENRPQSAGAQAAGRGKTKTFNFTEAEVNEFVGQLVQRENARSRRGTITVRSAEVRLKGRHVAQIYVIAALGPKALKLLGPEENSLIGKTLKRCVGFDNSLSLEFMLSSAKGTAFLQVLELKIKGVPVPDAVLKRLLKDIGQKQRPPVDFNKPVPLPNGIEKIDILPGRLSLRVQAL